MKLKIHPKFGPAKVSCACGHEWETGSTKKELKVEICSNCHPFFTGKQKLVDTGGRVERFKDRFGKKTEGDFSSRTKSAKEQKRRQAKESRKPGKK